MSRLAVFALVSLTASIIAAPVPVVKKNQWVLALDSHLYLFTEGDDKPTKLTAGEAVYDKPAWSPDGKRIAFRARKNGNDQVCVMNADGKNVVELTQGEQDHFDPSWSPDGRTIAFTRNVGVRKSRQICTVSAKDGSNLTVVSSSDDHCPTYSPDGKTIAFVAARERKYWTYTMTADGKDAERLVEQPVFSTAIVPAWSPDGTQIATTLSLGEGDELHLVRPDGRGLTALTKFGKGKMARCPSWSIDGKRLSFVLDDSTLRTKSTHALWVMDANGNNQKELLQMGSADGLFLPKAQWRPQ